MSDVDRVVEQLIVCPACGSGVELGVAGLACASCPVVLPITEGWCLDAVIDEEQLDDDRKKRFVGYDKPAAAALYDLDVRVTSNTLWRAPLARQVDFNRGALQAAAEARRAYLDVPVGTGLVLKRALEGAPAPHPIVVVDISMAMLRRARTRLGDRATYVRADVQRLPFTAGAFGVAHSGNGFHLFPDAAAAASEIRRVMAAGASGHFSTWIATPRPLASAYMRLLRRLRYINEPSPRSYFEAIFDSAGLRQVDATTTGSLLMWVGRTAS